MSIFEEITIKIIKEQELIIGPIAWQEAQKVPSLRIDKNHNSIKINGDKKKAIDNLVKQYGRLFGRASEEVCKEAAKTLLGKVPQTDIPPSLK